MKESRHPRRNKGISLSKVSSEAGRPRLVRKTAIEKALQQEIADGQRVLKALPKGKSAKITEKTKLKLSDEDLLRLNTDNGLDDLLKSKNIKLKDVLTSLEYAEELVLLQIELVKLQRWAQSTGKRIAVIFEGRDAAGKGGTIRRFTEHLNPRSMRVIAYQSQRPKKWDSGIFNATANSYRTPAKSSSSIEVGITERS